jgi:hypothetical protein
MIDERRRQAALDAMDVLDTPPNERVDRVARLAKEMFGVPMVSVSLLDRDRQWRKSQIGLDGPEAPRQDSFCDYTVRQNRTVIVEDATVTAEFAQNPFVTGDPHLRFYAAHPLYAPGGEPVGTLCILDTLPRSFDEEKGALLRDLAFWVQTELTRDADRDNAAAIQRALRPGRHPVIPGYTVAAAAVARDGLSGDYYDLSLHDGHLRITVADAMGKGTGPALVAAGVRASLRTAPERPLARAVAEADRLVGADAGDTGMFVTAVYADLEPSSGLLQVVDAGHGLAFIVRADGGWHPLRSIGLPIGMGGGTAEEREPTVAILERGDCFICCSDGLLDVIDPDDPFGDVERTIRQYGPEGAVREAIRRAGGDRATDDITTLVVRRDE